MKDIQRSNFSYYLNIGKYSVRDSFHLSPICVLHIFKKKLFSGIDDVTQTLLKFYRKHYIAVK